MWAEDGGAVFSVTLNLDRLLDMDVTAVDDVVVTGAVHKAGTF